MSAMKGQINKLQIVIRFCKVALLLILCYSIINSFLNLLSEETGITNSIDKDDVSKKIPMPAFTIFAFDTASFAYLFGPTQLSSKMGNGKEFPSWFQPHGKFAKYANETYLKQNYNLSWYDVWSMNAVSIGNKFEYGTFGNYFLKLTFTPPRNGFIEGVMKTSFSRFSIPIHSFFTF